MNKQAHTSNADGCQQRGQIVLSRSTPINPIQDMDMQTVFMYLESLCTRAEEGNAEAAREVFYLALRATAQLEAIVELYPDVLRGVRLTDVPVILGQTGIQTEKDLTALAAKFGVKWERKMRKDANPKIRKLVDQIAADLNRRRMDGADDNPSPPAFPISEILSADGWTPGEGGPTWKGWRDAARFLPPPSEKTAKIWWEVAEAYLRERFSLVVGKWFEHPEIFELTGKSKAAASIDTDKARGTAKKAIRDRFFEAVERLQAYTP